MTTKPPASAASSPRNITTEAARREAGAGSPTRHQGPLHVPGQSPESKQPIPLSFCLPTVTPSPALPHLCGSTGPRCRNSETQEHYTINGITSGCFWLHTLTAFKFGSTWIKETLRLSSFKCATNPSLEELVSKIFTTSYQHMYINTGLQKLPNVEV